MSPLWRDELRIWFAPGELRLRRMQRGVRPSCAADATLPVDSSSDWRPALESLEGCLGVHTWKGAGVRVVVSNRLARYAVVPWADSLTYEAEHLAHARICLADNYGNTGADWRVCLSDAPPGEARVACALPAALLDELRGIVDAHGIPLLSVQPALIEAYNRCRHQLPKSACWFVNIEPSVLVATRLGAKGWDSVYSARIGADWPTELLRLRMFAKFAAQDAADARMYVDGPERLHHAIGDIDPAIVWLSNSEGGTPADDQHRQSVSLQT